MVLPAIDIHHHVFPSTVRKDRPNPAIGWIPPPELYPWSPDLSLQLMDGGITIDSKGAASDGSEGKFRIAYTILSMPALHMRQGKDRTKDNFDEERAVARARNLDMAKIRDQHPQRFGFFGCVPFLDDIEGALAEIEYALDVLHADGISLCSSYGDALDSKYIAHPHYLPIWRLLNARHTTVFLHGAQIPSANPIADVALGIPTAEVPNETLKAAAHLVLSGVKRRFSSVRIVLAHMGGTLPAMAARVAGLGSYMLGASERAGVLNPVLPTSQNSEGESGGEAEAEGWKRPVLTEEEIMHDFRTFYFDTALSSYPSNVAGLEAFLKAEHLPDGPHHQHPEERILFGTDFPAVNSTTISWFTNGLFKHYNSSAGGEEENKRKLERILFKNALELFPRLKELEAFKTASNDG